MSSKRKPGRPPDADKRTAILNALTADPAEFFEIGTPPYNVALLASLLSMDASNLRKTLLQLEAGGIVAREVRQMDTWNAIAKDHQPRRCLCFWNTSTIEQDKVLIQQWRDRNRQRSNDAFEKLFK